jgi:serine/threonine-protein kinase
MRQDALVAGKYRLLRQIGAGGMGSVWLARNEVTERQFAIKFLHAGATSDEVVLARFLQEARVSGRLRHPSIVEILDAGTAPELEGAPFLVMELLDGLSLDQLVQRMGRLPSRLAVEIVLEIARAVAVAHEKGIVHRDLKPANIFLHRPGTGGVLPKVLDFGISKFQKTPTSVVTTGLTQTGALLGSPRYMSPEQAMSDKSIDGRSDVHALGVVLWECLVGAPPFDADTYNNLVVQIITGDRPALRSKVPDVSPSLEALVSRAMARRREDRFATVKELADALEAELARLGGPTLAARTAAAQLFDVLPAEATGPRAPQPQGSTTGAVSAQSAARATSTTKRAVAVGLALLGGGALRASTALVVTRMTHRAPPSSSTAAAIAQPAPVVEAGVAPPPPEPPPTGTSAPVADSASAAPSARPPVKHGAGKPPQPVDDPNKLF